MSEPYVGEIRMFGGNFAPLGWAFCSGQLLAISENDALFALVGTTYGGDGRTTFALPDLRGRIPVHLGSTFTIGQLLGSETVTLVASHLPAHSHGFAATDTNGSATMPSGAVLARNASADGYSSDTSVGLSPLNAAAMQATGGTQPHTNMAPYQCISFIIALFGIFPSRS